MINMTVEKYNRMLEEDGGICLHCREETYCIEPDAREYTCDACGMNRVYGIEELLIMEEVLIVEPSGDALDDE